MKKDISPEEYFKLHPDHELEDYMDAYPNGWNEYIAPSIRKSLEEEHWSIGGPLIGMNDEKEIIFHYRNNRIEKEFINEIQIVCRLDFSWHPNVPDGEYFLTGYLPMIFKKGDKVFVVQETYRDCEYPSQYGVLKKIYDKARGIEIDETYIGYNHVVEIEGIDSSLIPTSTQYFKNK